LFSIDGTSFKGGGTESQADVTTGSALDILESKKPLTKRKRQIIRQAEISLLF